MLNLVQHPGRVIGRARAIGVVPWTLNQVQGDGEGFACGARQALAKGTRVTGHHPVMLNLVQHPWRFIGRAHRGCVAPWTLNRVQGDGGVIQGDGGAMMAGVSR